MLTLGQPRRLLRAVVQRLEAVDGIEPLAERQLRPLVRSRSWAEQRAAFTVPTVHRDADVRNA